MTVQTMTYRCPHCNQPVDVEMGPANETLVCPNPQCQKPFKVEVPTAQPEPQPATPLLIPGASNGEHHPASPLVIPGASNGEHHPAPLAPPEPVAAPVAHPASEVKEETLQVIHLSMFRRYPFRCMAYFLLFIVSLVGTIFFAGKEWWFPALVCLAAGVVVVYRFIAWRMRMTHTLLTITNTRVILESGVFARHATEFPLADLEDIQINQTFVQRMFRVGDVVLLNKKGAAHRVLIMAVPSPIEVADTMHRGQRTTH
jgi:membrane protein YdbS with pleckstrin-like domain